MNGKKEGDTGQEAKGGELFQSNTPELAPTSCDFILYTLPEMPLRNVASVESSKSVA